GLLGMLAAVLFIVGVVVLILWAIGTIPGRPADDNAMEILRARYARGEIDDEQFAKAKGILGESHPRSPRPWGLLVGAVLLVVGLIFGLFVWVSFDGYGGMLGFGMMGMMGLGPTVLVGTLVMMVGMRFILATLRIK